MRHSGERAGFAATNTCPDNTSSPDEARPPYTQPRSASTGKRNRCTLAASGPHGGFTVTGQTARTLAALVKAGPHGVTALEVSSWAFRHGAYVHILRSKRGLVIETQREPHDCGWHGRYVLHSPVTLEGWRS